MADTTLILYTGHGDSVLVPLIDNGDGTHAIKLNVGVLPAANLGQKAMAASLSTVPANNITDATYIGDIKFGEALPAGEAHGMEVGTPATLITQNLVMDNGVAYADGDVLAITALLSNVARVNDGKAYPFCIEVIDVDDQGQPFDLLFFDANTSIGTINNANSIDDAGAATLLGWVRFLAADYTDFGGFRTAMKKDSDSDWHMGMWSTVTGTRNIYVAAISRGTGTYTTNGIKLRISIGQN